MASLNTPLGGISAARRQKEELEQRKQMLIEMISAYDKGTTYTTLIFAAGYAGYFAIWDWVREYMTRVEMLTTALLIGISLAMFIFWQVYTMFFISKQHIALDEVINKQDLDSALITFNAEMTKLQIRYAKIWRVVFVLTTAPGIAGAVVLLCVIAKHLFSGA